ncbi:predicted protein [Chaetoceros tenuissimus]|uniref:Uncharacterized protein n=1 Tax=Chaetoceros tenuissimus TaxID=426638 RepID=A0AAD3GZP4_9STRA|nr:predicted protein [Chaetoceros tenuissimus]
MNQANQPNQTVLPKDTQVPFIVVTNHNDNIIPDFIKQAQDRDVSKQFKAKRIDTYQPGHFTSLLTSISQNDYTKNRCILFKRAGMETGGIKMNETDAAGHEMEKYNVFTGDRLINANTILPGNGPKIGVRRAGIPIPDNALLKKQTKIQLEPARQNIVPDAEFFPGTSATVFTSPGNETPLQGLYTHTALYGSVCNLPKLLRPFDNHRIATDLENEYLNVIRGDNELGYFTKKKKGTKVKVPWLVLKCIAIVENDLGGFDYFFQFYKTMLAILENTWWLTFPITRELSQFQSSSHCCVAFVAFLHYHGIAPIHNIECAMHTRFRYNQNDDWNNIIGYFRVTQGGIGFTDIERINAITQYYHYRLLNGVYPFFEDEEDQPELDETNVDDELLGKLELISKFCMGSQEEDKIMVLEKLDEILSLIDNGEEPMTMTELAVTNQLV